MKKKTIVKLTAVILILSLFAGFSVPAFAYDEPEIGPTWQDVIESVTPCGDAPYLTLELMPNGYIFTDYYVPREYDITLKDGTVMKVHIPRAENKDLYFSDGEHIGYFLDVDTGGETLTLLAYISFNEESKESIFRIAQFISAIEEIEGVQFYKLYEFPIFEEPCRTEIDDSSFIARILYPLFSAFEKIRQLFWGIIYKLGI